MLHLLSYTLADAQQPSLLWCRSGKTQAIGLHWHA